MKKLALYAACVVAAAFPVLAQEEAKEVYPSPGEIVAKASAEEWVAIPPADLMVMDLAKDRDGKSRRVVIQLMPAPFSQGWVGNIRKLVAARWYDGVSVNRVQDNYVVQWGDANYDNPAATGKAKKLPDKLNIVPQSAYEAPYNSKMFNFGWHRGGRSKVVYELTKATQSNLRYSNFSDPYSMNGSFVASFPVGYTQSPTSPTYVYPQIYSPASVWPIHCYGMVGVGRNLSPDTGSGAELYTVIGHAPRHLDRNIALVGRVIEGIEHLSSLPRGTGALGFYEKEEERVPIVSVRMGDETADLPAFEYLATDGATFAAYADARANRRDPFFNIPAGGADICNIPVPVRRKP